MSDQRNGRVDYVVLPAMIVAQVAAVVLLVLTGLAASGVISNFSNAHGHTLPGARWIFAAVSAFAGIAVSLLMAWAFAKRLHLHR